MTTEGSNGDDSNSENENLPSSPTPLSTERAVRTWPNNIFRKEDEHILQFLEEVFCNKRQRLYFPENTLGKCNTELDRQWSVQWRFFSPRLDPYVNTHDMVFRFLKNRFCGISTPMKIEGVSPRRIITAERGAIEMSYTLCTNGATLGSSNQFGIRRNSLWWLLNQTEAVNLNGTNIQYRYEIERIRRNHMGNYRMNGIRTYDNILQFFLTLAANQDQEKKLASMLLGYAKTGKAIRKQQMVDAFREVSTNEVDKFNIQAYHIMVKEVARHMCAEKEYDLPVAIVQARALKLVECGELTLKEVFQLDADYGVVTAENVYLNNDDAIEKVKRINDLYNRTFLNSREKNRRELHQELRETYCDISNNDSSDYSDDEERGNDDSDKKQPNNQDDREYTTVQKQLEESKISD
ncbi:unnamed protein product [Rotaria socialis]|uniref:Uncharacterized protein n=1 Tax=Rotaria socialis TaxID=392032 RepID=A0A821NGC3_9BILA|nr:unnamed protein product [Rotaria socialis]CAF4787693.1 unnamed protein product [Rotaria socialis]